MTQQAEPQIKNEPMELEKKGTLADLLKQLSSLWYGLAEQGLWVSFLGLAEFFIRFVTGAPIQRLSQVTPQLHVSGQHQGRGWKHCQNAVSPPWLTCAPSLTTRRQALRHPVICT